MAAANSSAAVLPDWPQLNFSRNCTAYGRWLAAFIAPDPWNPQEALGGSIPLSLVLFTDALPAGWTFSENATGGEDIASTITSSAGTAYFSDVMQWFTARLYHTYNTTDRQWYADPAFVDNVIWAPADRCPREFCKAIAFAGNADLSGIGVVISYYIEASLTSLYLVVLTAWRLRRWRRGRRRIKNSPSSTRPPSALRRAGRRLFDALRGSLDSFLTSATVLALAILVAAIVMAAKRTADRRRHPVDAQNIPSGSALYDSALGLLVGLYAVFPVVVLYALLPDGMPEGGRKTSPPSSSSSRHPGRRTGLRRAVLVALWALAAAVVFVDPRSELDYDYQGASTPADGGDDNDFADVLYACDQRGGRLYWRVLTALRYLVVGAPLLWLLLTGAVYYATRRQRRPAEEAEEAKGHHGERTSSAARAVWRHAVAWLCCAIMWTILLCLTELRQNIIDVADGLDTENDWAFGQILAIATWGPVVADFAFLLLFGIEAGLGGRLPLDYTIRRVESAPSLGSTSGSSSATAGDAASHADDDKTTVVLDNRSYLTADDGRAISGPHGAAC